MEIEFLHQERDRKLRSFIIHCNHLVIIHGLQEGRRDRDVIKEYTVFQFENFNRSINQNLY